MKTIYKYVLNAIENNIIELPLGATILSVNTQGESIVIYAMINSEEKETTSYEFLVHGTGHKLADNLMATHQFLGTVKLYEGSLMFHVFYKQIKLEEK